MPVRNNDTPGSSRDYKRGAVMGLTVAEAFILLTFVLLLLFTWWQAAAEKRNLDAAKILGQMSDTERRDLVAGLSDGTFEMAKQLREAGVRPGDAAALADTSNYTRFMREEDLKRLMNGAVELAPGTRISLADAVEITPETRLRAALDNLLDADDAVAQVTQRLADAAADQQRVVSMLNGELGERISAAGGAISADGTITLPQDILFDPGSSQIRNPTFLREFCTPWISTLRSTGLDISELKIEGHASSEGLPRQTSEQAYLYNLGLSQRRAQNALEVCLQDLSDPELLDWARSHLSSTGYSSVRLVKDADGNEDRQASRRVMFSMEMNREQLIRDIQDDLQGMSSSRDKHSQGTAATSQGGRADVIDGDTLRIGDIRWRLHGIDAPERDQRCVGSGGDEYACGEVARDRLLDLIGEMNVTCDEIDKDRYGRSVGVCWAGGKDLGKELVILGMAVPYVEYSTAYEAQGEAARAAKVGLWSGEFEMPSAFRSAERKQDL